RGRQGHADRGLGPVCGDAASDRRLGLVHRQRVRRSVRLPAIRSEDEALRILCHSEGRHRCTRRDIDKNGVLWGSGSNGSLIRFDRTKCKNPLNGPNATGNHCSEGFSFFKYPGPGFEGFENSSAEASYYTWVDHHNTVGLGENIPISTANLNDGFVAFKD